MTDRFSKNGISSYKFLLFPARSLRLDPKKHFCSKFAYFRCSLQNFYRIWKFWKKRPFEKKNYTSANFEKSKICRIETDQNIFLLSFYAVDFWFFENCGRIIFFSFGGIYSSIHEFSIISTRKMSLTVKCKVGFGFFSKNNNSSITKKKFGYVKNL